MTDVSATVRARVEGVPALAAKLREVDEFLRRPLAFREEPLPGGAVGGADYEAGLVRLPASEEGPGQVQTRMERCVRDHLKLPEGAASIDRLPRP